MVHRPGDRLRNVQSTRPAATLARPPRSPEPPGRKRRWKPVSALEFVGCESCRMTRADYEAYPADGRKIEYYDVEAELAWMAEDGPSLEHEKPGAKLAALLRELAMTRGSPIECRGAASLHLLDAEAGQVGVIHPDQMVFLDPEAAELPNDFRVVGEGAHPDVVLEVDHTTDVRRGKLTRYEEWGFPELWVEVPDTFSAGRRGGLATGPADLRAGRWAVHPVGGEPGASRLAGGGDPSGAEREGDFAGDFAGAGAGGPDARGAGRDRAG